MHLHEVWRLEIPKGEAGHWAASKFPMSMYLAHDGLEHVMI